MDTQNTSSDTHDNTVQYELTGTLEDLEIMLRKEFGMDETCSRLFIALQLIDIDKDDLFSENDFEDPVLWPLTKNPENYQSVVPTGPYPRISISFTEAKKELCKNFLINIPLTIVDFLFSFPDQDPDCIKTILKYLLKVSGLTIKGSATYIDNNHYCVFFSALQWKIKHHENKLFSIDDIFPLDNEGKKCPYSLKVGVKWSCSHYKGIEQPCDIKKDVFKRLTDDLVEKHVFYSYDDQYGFEV